MRFWKNFGIGQVLRRFMSTNQFQVGLAGNPLTFVPSPDESQQEFKSSSLFLPFHNLKPLVSSVSSPSSYSSSSTPMKLVWAEYSQLNSSLDSNTNVVYLGDFNQTSYYACEVKDESPLNSRGQFRSLFTLLVLLSKEDAIILAQAKAFIEWHSLNKFCGVCGKPTKSINNGRKRVCTNERKEGVPNSCGRTIYPRTDPVVIMLVIHPDKKRVLLGRGSRHPTGMYSCLAGFVEPGETIEEAVKRETREEVGVSLSKVDYLCSQPWPALGGQLMIGCIGYADGEEIKVDETELEGAKWFEVEDVRKAYKRSLEIKDFYQTQDFRIPPPTAIAHTLIKSWIETQTPSNSE